MALTLITGRANTGKTGIALDAFREALDRGGEPILVVPSSPDAERATVELAKEYPAGVRVMRFDGLVEFLWGLHGDHRAIITPTQRRALLLRGPGLSGSGAVSAGFADLVSRVIEHVASAGPEWRTMRSVKGDAAEVSESILRYAEELEHRGLVEPAEAGRAVATSLSARDVIIFHRFDDLTDIQAAFVEAASAGAADVRVSVTWEEGFPPTEAMTALVRRLGSQGSIIASDAPDAYTHPDLQRVDRELFQGPEAQPDSEALRFIAGEGPEAEADHIAGHAAGLIASGIAPERIAIVWRDLSSAHRTIRRALREAGIAADIDAVVPFGETSFGRAFSDAVRFVADGSRDALLALLRSGYLCADATRVLELESVWRQEGVFKPTRLIRDVAKGASWQSLLSDLAREPRRGDDAAARWDELASQMIGERHGAACDEESRLAEDAHVRAALARLLDDCRQLDGVALSARDLGELLEGHAVAPRMFEQVGHVQVTSAERVRGRRFEAVIVGGLNAGAFPAMREDALYGEALRPLFDAAGAAAPEPGGAAAERALLYGVVTRARSVLVLSRLLTDAAGDPVGPSVFWEELRDFCRVPVPDDESGDDEPESVLSFSETGLVTHATSSLRGGTRGAALALCSAEGTCDAPERLARAHARSRQAIGRAGQDDLGGAFEKRDTFSAGELETYARCPYQWFLQKAIGGEALEFEVGALLKGSVSHDALEHVYSPVVGADGAGYPVPEEEVEERSREAAAAAVRASKAPRSERDSLVAEITPRVARSLRADALAFPGFVPERLEWGFGIGEEPPAPLGPFRLRGRVDRIDVRDRHAIVVDYKSGRVGDYTRAKLAENPTIQVPLYAHAAHELLGLDVVGAVYRGLGDGATRGVLRDETAGDWAVVKTDRAPLDEMAGLVERAVGIGVAAAEGIRAGCIDRVGGDHCRWCPVAGWCGEYTL